MTVIPSACVGVALPDTIEGGKISVVELDLDRGHVLLKVRHRACFEVDEVQALYSQ